MCLNTRHEVITVQSIADGLMCNLCGTSVQLCSLFSQLGLLQSLLCYCELVIFLESSFPFTFKSYYLFIQLSNQRHEKFIMSRTSSLSIGILIPLTAISCLSSRITVIRTSVLVNADPSHKMFDCIVNTSCASCCLLTVQYVQMF